ncbi:MAG: glycosyltransferase family 87 protein [Tepidisphaeraceae bacterium]|jgi:hypothetical protein
MKRAATIATAILGLLACLNIFAGVHHLFTQTTTHVDLHLRWVDQQYILRGQNPYDVCFAARSGDVQAYEQKTGRNSRPFADLGVPQDVGYPPWSFVIGTLLYWPPWEMLPLWCTAINLAALGYLAWWASRLAPNARLAMLFAVGALACSGHVGTLRVGQGTIVVLALLAAAHRADCAGRPLVSGLLLGLALMKPTVAGPFVLCLLISGRWKALASCVLYLLGASCLIWWQTGVNPAEMTLQMFEASRRFLADGTGPMNLALRVIPDPGRASAALSIICLIAATATMYRLCARPLLELFGIAAICGRFWTYHRGYDDTAIIFLVAALTMLALETRRPTWFIAAVGVGVTLWMPGALYSDHTGPVMDAVNVMRMLVWIPGAVLLAVGVYDPPWNSASTNRCGSKVSMSSGVSPRPTNLTGIFN